MERRGSLEVKKHPHKSRTEESDKGKAKKRPIVVEPGEHVTGFLDESTRQASANIVRMWSFEKPVIIKNATKFRVNTFDFYSFNRKGMTNVYL